MPFLKADENGNIPAHCDPLPITSHFRNWLLKLLIGKKPVFANIEVGCLHREGADPLVQINDLGNGLFINPTFRIPKGLDLELKGKN